jgi:hypothetical protein
MTEKHKAAVSKAVNGLLDHWIDTTETGAMAVPLAKIALVLIDIAAKNYPADRSCFTCDFLHGRTCHRWGDTVPDSAIEAGCGEHDETGAPF